MYIIRRIAFILVCFIMYEPQYTVMQVFANIYIGLLFVLYLTDYMPFKDKWTNIM